MPVLHGLARVCHVCERREAAQQLGMDGSGGFAMQLLIEDGLGERLKGRLF